VFCHARDKVWTNGLDRVCLVLGMYQNRVETVAPLDRYEALEKLLEDVKKDVVHPGEPVPKYLTGG
jgi:hypothetical protein